MSSKKARNEVDGEVETQVSSDEELQRVDRRHQKGSSGHGASGLVFW